MAASGRIVPVTTILLYSRDDAIRSQRLMTHAMGEIRIQFKRIRSDIDGMNAFHSTEPMTTAQEARTKSYHDQMQELFADIHFLLVSLNRLRVFFEKGIMKSKISSEPEIRKVGLKYRGILQILRHFRNCLEHIDERASAGKSDLGQVNLADSIFIFDGKEICFGSALEKQVEEFFSDVNSTADAVNKRRRVSEQDRIASGVIKVP